MLYCILLLAGHVPVSIIKPMYDVALDVDAQHIIGPNMVLFFTTSTVMLNVFPTQALSGDFQRVCGKMHA